MARSPAKPPSFAPKQSLSVSEIERGIERLQQRIYDIEKFDIYLVASDQNPPELRALATSIERTIAKIFGDGTSDYLRYLPGSDVLAEFVFASSNFPMRNHYVEQINKKMPIAKHILQEAIKALTDDLSDMENSASASESLRSIESLPQTMSRKVFIVHGHEGEPREAVAGFLRKIDFIPVILHEQTNQGRTIVEKFESQTEVSFAIVLLTPDDVGGARGREQKPRARQNVILELGYFMGKLGRKNVCAIRLGDDLELPSDFLGVVWTAFDNYGAWKTALAKELRDAGHEVDWNKVTGP